MVVNRWQLLCRYRRDLPPISVTFPQQFARRAARLRSQRPLRYTYSHYGAVAPRPTQGGHS